MDEQYRQRVHERAMEMIRSGEYDNLGIPDRGARLGRNNQDDWSLSYSIRDIPTFDGNGDSLPQMHMLEFSDFLDNTGSEFRDLPQEPQADDREYHMAVIKDVVSNSKVSLKGKPRLWFEMQYLTSADEPKTKEAYEKMIASFITEHNPIGSTKEQLTMAWKTLNWNPAQERLDDFVYKFRRIGQELGITEDQQLEYFKCSVPPHLYLYHKDATTIKEAMENIKRACALGGVSVFAPVEPRTTQSAPFMQMIDSPDSRNEPRKSDHAKFVGLKFQGKVEYIDEILNKLDRMLEQQDKELRKYSKDRYRRSSRDSRDSRDIRDSRGSRYSRDYRDSRNSRDSRRSYRSDSDSNSEDDRQRSRSRDSSRSRSGSRGRTIKNCTYCHKPNHDWSHCYRYPKDIKKVCSGNLKIDDSRDKDEQARWQMLIDPKNYIESEKDSTN